MNLLSNTPDSETYKEIARYLRRRRPKRPRQFASKAMTRGVQKRLAAAANAARLPFIWESMRQGIRIAKERRAAYLLRRDDRHRKIFEAAIPNMLLDIDRLVNEGGPVDTALLNPVMVNMQ